MIRNSVGALCLVLLYNLSAAQPQVPDTGFLSAAAQAAVATYQQALPVEKEIYNGPEHIAYLPTIEGVAYFDSKDWQTGTVVYDGIQYENLMLLYDLVKDKLVLKRHDGFGIEVRSEKVSHFTINNHHFIGVQETKGLKPGFYEQLASGKLTILARHSNQLKERVETNRLLQYFQGATTYHAIKEDTNYNIRNLSTVWSIIDIDRGAIQQQLKKSGITFKKNKELALKTVADYYNKTQR